MREPVQFIICVDVTAMNANHLKFCILLVFQILSLPCFLYVFYQFRSQRQFRRSHHHHVILLLLIVSFLFVLIPLPFTQAFLITSYVYPSSPFFCAFWNWIHYSLNIVNVFLMAFASVERHWLIFHPRLVRSRRGKIVLHYCPLFFCLAYPTLFYFGFIFIWPCRSHYSYWYLFCGYPCYLYNTQWYNFDLFVNNYAPLVMIPLGCGLIYVRVCLQRRTMRQQAFKWSRDKKIILELWALSSLYLAMWMPMQLAGLINLYWDPNFLLQAQFDYMFLFPYFIHLLYPFIVLFTYRHEMLKFPRRRSKIGAIFH